MALFSATEVGWLGVLAGSTQYAMLPDLDRLRDGLGPMKELPLQYTPRGSVFTSSTEFQIQGRDWAAVPKLEDLAAGQRILQSFSGGWLRLTEPLLAVGRKSLDGHVWGVTILEEMVENGKILWLDLPPAPRSTKISCPLDASPQRKKGIQTIKEAQKFFNRAYHQMPNAFYVGSGEPRQLTTWLNRYSPFARYEQSNASAAGLSGIATGIPLRILHDHVDRTAWLLDGETDRTTGCQHVVMIGEHIHAGSLENLLKRPNTCYREPALNKRVKGVEKRYFEIKADDLTQFSISSPQELDGFFQQIYIDQPAARVSWATLRDNLAEMDRLSRILATFDVKFKSESKRPDLDTPSALAALADKATRVEQSTRKLSHGVFHLGIDLSKKHPPKFVKEYLPAATDKGKQTQTEFANGVLKRIKDPLPSTRSEDPVPSNRTENPVSSTRLEDPVPSNRKRKADTMEQESRVGRMVEIGDGRQAH